MFKKLAFAGAFVALAILAGCSGLGTAGAILSGSVANPVTPARALILHTTFKDSVEIPVAFYVALPRCSHSPAPCSDQKVVNQARIYVNAAVKALRALDDWALGNTALNGPALFAAAQFAVAQARDYGLTHAISGVK
jgi:hypothetical protein